MAYKDVLVYLIDPSAEAIKRLRFAADLPASTPTGRG